MILAVAVEPPVDLRSKFMELIERMARVIAGYRLSANADGSQCSAAEAVDALWAAHMDEAMAILKSMREPSPTMLESGLGGEWGVMIDREIERADGGG